MTGRAVTLRPIDGLQRPLCLHTHDPDADLVSRRLHEDGQWEPFETRLWLAAQRRGDVVVDVGANLGYFSLLSALAWRAPGPVFAFEPAADNFDLLCSNLAANDCAGQVEPVQAALGSRGGDVLLMRSDTNRGDHQVYAGDGQRAAEPVRLLRGDAFLAPRVDRIDLLKIDTQGSELDVLLGLWPLLERSRACLRILVELTPYSLLLAGSSGRALIERLAALDLPLAIVDHLEHRLVPSDAGALARWCDNVSATPGDRGFMNIFVGEAPALAAA